jgi:hypothetical protein
VWLRHGRLLEPDYLHTRRVFGASASSAFYRRGALLRVGSFPESFGAYFEDVDLAFRLNRAATRQSTSPHRGFSIEGQLPMVPPGAGWWNSSRRMRNVFFGETCPPPLWAERFRGT